MLTTKKKKFADARKRGLSQREAAVYAGYSQSSAKVKGCQLDRDPEVKKYLLRLTSEVNFSGEKVNPKVNPKVNRDEPKNRSENQRIPVVELVADGASEALEVITRIMRENMESDPKLALDAAYKLATFTIRKPDAMGKKEHKTEKAKVAVSRFAPSPPPQNIKH